jgi:hypothetical protein
MTSRHFNLGDFIECGETYHRLDIDNTPQETASIVAIEALSNQLLEPLRSEFGNLQLTYGLATRHLLAHIDRRIAPRYDQHAAHERNARGNRICDRDGFAVDFKITGVSSLAVAKHVVAALPFDRLYYYHSGRPLHVSHGPEHSKKICVMQFNQELDRWFPRNTTIEKFLNYNEQ